MYSLMKWKIEVYVRPQQKIAKNTVLIRKKQLQKTALFYNNIEIIIFIYNFVHARYVTGWIVLYRVLKALRQTNYL